MSFFRGFQPALVMAFSTASSNATMPVSLELAERRLGVPRPLAAFMLPLGATINMDGTAIMQGVATVFMAQVYGVPLGLSDAATIIVMATLVSIGTAGVPGVGLVMLVMVLRQVVLLVEGFALIMAWIAYWTWPGRPPMYRATPWSPSRSRSSKENSIWNVFTGGLHPLPVRRPSDQESGYSSRRKARNVRAFRTAWPSLSLLKKANTISGAAAATQRAADLRASSV